MEGLNTALTEGSVCILYVYTCPNMPGGEGRTWRCWAVPISTEETPGVHPWVVLPNLAHSLLQIKDPPGMAPQGSTWWQNTTALKRESLSDSRVSAGMWQQTARADLYSWDLIKHKLSYFPVPFVVISEFVLSVEAERLKKQLYFLPQRSDCWYSERKKFQTLLLGEVLTLSDTPSSSSLSFWSAQLAPGNRINKGLCSWEIFAHCVCPHQENPSLHYPTCWFLSWVSLSHRDTAGRCCSSFSHTHWAQTAGTQQHLTYSMFSELLHHSKT